MPTTPAPVPRPVIVSPRSPGTWALVTWPAGSAKETVSSSPTQAAPASEPASPAASAASNGTWSSTVGGAVGGVAVDPAVEVEGDQRVAAEGDLGDVGARAEARGGAAELGRGGVAEVVAVAADVEPGDAVAADDRVQLGGRRGGDRVAGQLAGVGAAGADLVGVEDLARDAEHDRVELGVDDHLLDRGPRVEEARRSGRAGWSARRTRPGRRPAPSGESLPGWPSILARLTRIDHSALFQIAEL